VRLLAAARLWPLGLRRRAGGVGGVWLLHGAFALAYALAVAAFAALYFALGAISGPPTSPGDALLASVTAFHGRVFAGQFGLGMPQSWVTAAEAVVGLVIESVFVAMLTQRFFFGN
jgi:hypothetical protein